MISAPRGAGVDDLTGHLLELNYALIDGYEGRSEPVPTRPQHRQAVVSSLQPSTPAVSAAKN